MRYIGKIWFNEPIAMVKAAEMLGLYDITTLQTEDIIGAMKWRGGCILVFLHLSWGANDKAEKIRIYVHHLEDTEDDNFWILIKEKLKSIVNYRSLNETDFSRASCCDLSEMHS